MNLLNLLPIEENLRNFFGYAAALSIGYMVLATIMLIFLKGPLSLINPSSIIPKLISNS